MELRELCDSDSSQHREMFNLSFPETLGTPMGEASFYEWKFRSIPAHTPSYEYVFEDEGRLLGYYAALPMTYRIGSRVSNVGLVVDVMTHPDARGKGVFVKTGAFSLNQLRLAGIDLTLGYPIRPEVLPGHLKVGWKVAFELPMYLRVLRADSLLAGKVPAVFLKALNPLLAAFTGASKLWRARPQQVAQLATEDFLASEDVWEFYQRFHQARQNIWLREPQTLAWRLGRPDANYVCFTHRGADGAIDGVLLARPTQLKGVSTLGILDVCVLGGSQSSGALLAAAENYALERGLDTLCMMASRHMAGQLELLKNAYLQSPFKFKLIVNALNPEVDQDALLQESAWHLGWIDTDDL